MKKYLLFAILLLLGFDPFGITIANAQYTKLLDFAGSSNGSEPRGDLISDGAFLYGMTTNGGSDSMGVIFKVKPDGTAYSKLFDFDSTNGSGSLGSLISDGTFLYGMTGGTIFKIKPDGTGYLKLFDFTGSNGIGAIGSLISDGTFLYGMTSFGGINVCDHYGGGCGVLFKIKTDGTGYSKLMDFGSGSGANPFGSLIFDGTFLYGMTRYGGSSTSCSSYGCGEIFKIKPNGTGYSDLYDFDGSKGGAFGSLIFDGTFLYGMTAGMIFKIKPDGTGYSDLFDFTGPNGDAAHGSLIFDGTFLYGMTREGGSNISCPGGCGVIFKIRPDGTGYSKLLDFTNMNGSDPMGSLISDGTSLYGMTRTGGTNNMGVVFSINASGTTGINQAINIEKETLMSVFPNPANNTVTIKFYSSIKNELLIIIKNPLGQTVYSENKKDFPGEYINTIDLSKQPKGIYFIEMNCGDQRKTKKILLQ